MNFGSVCSGIEAASVAFGPLGWKADWFAEIEPFPSAVLAHHYPEVTNLGDMTKIARQVLDGSVAAPDVLCGGTPCQAFSVAGLRNSMADERGGLTLKFVELANAIDHVRTRRGEDECIVFWENVPGVLSTKDNAFGCFLGSLVGESIALEPTGGGWTDAGCVYGPKRAVAWRVLDAQYFGLAQRRRRVFVVASARRGFDPAEVLFEREGVRRDTAPRRGTGQDVAGRAPFGPALQCGCGYVFQTGLGAYGCPNCEGDEGPAVSVLAGVPAFGAGKQDGSVFQAPTLTATGGRLDFDSEVFAAVAPTIPSRTTAGGGMGTDFDCDGGLIAHTLRGEGFDASEDGTGRGTPLVPVAFTTKLHNTQSNQAGKVYENYATSLDANSPPPALLTAMQVRRLTPVECERLQGFPLVVAKLTFDVCIDHQSSLAHVAVKCHRSLSSASLVVGGESMLHANTAGQPSSTSQAGQKPLAVLRVRMHSEDELLELRSLGRLIWSANGAPASNASPPPTLSANTVQELARLSRDLATSVGLGRAESLPSISLSTQAPNGARLAQTFTAETEACAMSAVRDQSAERFTTLSLGHFAPTSDSTTATLFCCAARAIAGSIPATTLSGSFSFEIEVSTPYTAIPWRKKPASECPDGPRYKALGNSWAVFNVRWIGFRIEEQIRARLEVA